MNAANLPVSRTAVVVSVFVAAALWMYGGAVATMHEIWTSDSNPTYSHGWLLAAVVLVMVVHRWLRMTRSPVLNPSIAGAAAVLLVSAGWLLSVLANIQLGVLVTVPALVIALLIALLGFRQGKWFIFPVALLLGALPLWDFAGIFLQGVTAVVTGWLVKASMIPMVREGMLIMVPAGTFEVARGCSGLSYVITAVVLGFIFGYMRGLKVQYTLLVAAAAVPVALMANIIRVYTIIVAGQVSGMRSYFITEEHVSLGWVVFAISITCYLWAVGRWGVRDTWVGSHAPGDRTETPTLSYRPIRLGMILVFLAAGPVAYAVFYSARLEAEVPALALRLPPQLGGYTKVDSAYDYRPGFGKPDAQAESVYARSGKSIYLYVGYFHVQRQGKEAINDLNRLADGHRWVKASSRLLQPETNGAAEVREARLRARNGDERLVWQWYDIGGRQVADRLKGKALSLVEAIRGRTSARVVVLATDMDDGRDAAARELAGFMEALEATGNLVIRG